MKEDKVGKELVKEIRRRTSLFGQKLFQHAGVLRDGRIDLTNPLDADLVIMGNKIKPLFGTDRKTLFGFTLFGQTTEDIFFKEIKDRIKKEKEPGKKRQRS